MPAFHAAGPAQPGPARLPLVLPHPVRLASAGLSMVPSVHAAVNQSRHMEQKLRPGCQDGSADRREPGPGPGLAGQRCPCAAVRSRLAVRTLAAFDVSWTCNGLVCNGTARRGGAVSVEVNRGSAAGPDLRSPGTVVAHRPTRPVHQHPGDATTHQRYEPVFANPRGAGLRDARDTRIATPPANARCRPRLATARLSPASGRPSPAGLRASPQSGDRPAPKRRPRGRRPELPAPLSAAR